MKNNVIIQIDEEYGREEYRRNCGVPKNSILDNMSKYEIYPIYNMTHDKKIMICKTKYSGYERELNNIDDCISKINSLEQFDLYDHNKYNDTQFIFSKNEYDYYILGLFVTGRELIVRLDKEQFESYEEFIEFAIDYCKDYDVEEYKITDIKDYIKLE